jgi:hypothetical protein
MLKLGANNKGSQLGKLLLCCHVLLFQNLASEQNTVIPLSSSIVLGWPLSTQIF